MEVRSRVSIRGLLGEGGSFQEALEERVVHRTGAEGRRELDGVSEDLGY